MLRYLTAGESHGKYLIAILEGVPAGLVIDLEAINHELRRRQSGHGRGKRMQEIELDRIEVLAGLRKGESLGSPIAIRIENVDSSVDELPPVKRPRPGHADLAGGLKYSRHDLRDILERASARETAARVAVGSVCRQLLGTFGAHILSHVTAIGGIQAHTADLSFDQIGQQSTQSPLNCADEAAEKLMMAEIDRMAAEGDTLGGIFEVRIVGLPPGLGSHVHYDRRLDGLLAGAVMSIQGVKAVEMGSGVDMAAKSGSHVHDEIFYEAKKGFFRKTNRAGGIEGGISTGEEVILRGYMKPIATLKKPLKSVDIETKEPSQASVERGDVCAVPSAGVIAEAVCAFELAKVFLEKFGGDSMAELRRNYEGYRAQITTF